VESLGGIAALISAFCFAVASVFFRRVGEEVSPIMITIVKSIIACLLSLLLIYTIGDPDTWIYSQANHPLPKSISNTDISLLILSGFLGITIGDTAYFATLNALGTRRTLLLDTLSPACTGILAVLFLGETLSITECVSIIAILWSVGWVLREKVHVNSINPSITSKALFLGLLNIGCHSLAILTAKQALENVPSLEASIIRQGSALIMLLFWLLIKGNVLIQIQPLRKIKTLRMLGGASICGSFLGIWFGLIGLKLAPASIAATLNSTTPIFILPVNRIIEKQSITSRSFWGALIAFSASAYLLY
jgi:drug/metabolite transporter (DMT)-like permease